MDNLAEKTSLVNPQDAFFNNLPKRPYCSNSKKLELILPKKEAIAYKYIQAQHGIVHYLLYDLDYAGSAFAAREKGIAEATLCVINRTNGHAHYLYEIDPIYPQTASAVSKDLLRDVQGAYKEMLDADRAWTGQKQLIKNCLSGAWDVLTGRAHTLGELAEYIPAGVRKYKRSHIWTPGHTMPAFEDCIRHGRNSTLFEFIRHYAYRIAGGCDSLEELYQSLYFEAAERNQRDIPRTFKKPMLTSEVRGIVKSISGWVWKRKDTFKRDFKNVGVMGFKRRRGVFTPPAEFERETRRRQKEGGYYTARLKREGRKLAINGAIEALRAQNRRVTQKAVALEVGISQVAISRFYGALLKI